MEAAGGRGRVIGILFKTLCQSATKHRDTFLPKLKLANFKSKRFFNNRLQ
jgi:hypothetical protein